MKSEIFSSLPYITKCFMLSNVTTLSEIDLKTSLWLYSRVSNRLLIIPFFTTLPNLIQHSPFINFGGFCQPPFYSRLPVYQFMCTVDIGSVKHRQSHKTVCCRCCFFHIAQNCFLITMKHNVA